MLEPLSHAEQIQPYVPPAELPATFPPGRDCAEDGCITILNRFNPGPWCYCHAGRHERELAEVGIERELAAAA